MGIPFNTLRRRSPALLQEVAGLPAPAWRRVTRDASAGAIRTPRVFEQSVSLAGATLLNRFSKGRLTAWPLTVHVGQADTLDNAPSHQANDPSWKSRRGA